MRSLMLCVVMLLLGFAQARADLFVFPVSTLPGNQKYPDVSGNIVVWEKEHSDVWFVFGRTLPDGGEFQIPTTSWYRPHSAVSGNTVVYQRGEDIYAYDISTSIEIPICNDPYLQTDPAISGNIVVWEDYRGPHSSNVYGYDTAAGLEFLVCGDIGSQFLAEVDGNFIVWEDRRNSQDIYCFEYPDGPGFPIIHDADVQMHPGISGNTVVWMDDRNANWDLYGYNLCEKTEFPICIESGDQKYPSISENFIVWTDGRNGNWDIYGYNLFSGEEFPIWTGPGDQMYPRIDKGTVVWQDYRAGEWDIYGAVIPEPSILILMMSVLATAGLAMLVHRKK